MILEYILLYDFAIGVLRRQVEMIVQQITRNEAMFEWLIIKLRHMNFIEYKVGWLKRSVVKNIKAYCEESSSWIPKVWVKQEKKLKIWRYAARVKHNGRHVLWLRYYLLNESSKYFGQRTCLLLFIKENNISRLIVFRLYWSLVWWWLCP